MDRVGTAARHRSASPAQQQANGFGSNRRSEVAIFGGVELVHQIRVVALERHYGLVSKIIRGESILVPDIRQPVVGSLLVGVQGLSQGDQADVDVGVVIFLEERDQRTMISGERLKCHARTSRTGGVGTSPSRGIMRDAPGQITAWCRGLLSTVSTP